MFWNVTKQIEKGDEIFGDYGPQFWENFDQDGQKDFASSVASDASNLLLWLTSQASWTPYIIAYLRVYV